MAITTVLPPKASASHCVHNNFYSLNSSEISFCNHNEFGADVVTLRPDMSQMAQNFPILTRCKIQRLSDISMETKSDSNSPVTGNMFTKIHSTSAEILASIIKQL